MKKAKPATTRLVILAITTFISSLVAIISFLFIKPIEGGIAVGIISGVVIWGIGFLVSDENEKIAKWINNLQEELKENEGSAK